MRKCIKCEKQKKLELFRKIKKWFSHTCKECYASQYRTGKINLGRFPKGHKPTHGFGKGHKTSKPFLKGQIPWNKGRYTSKGRGSAIKRWAREIKERDGYKCMKCDSKENLEAHHIIPWKENLFMKHDISNGITVCRSCHIRLEPRNVRKKVINGSSKRNQ